MVMKKPTKRRKRTIRQTSDRVSRIAARYQAELREYEEAHGELNPIAYWSVTIRDLKAMAGSLMNQDQTRGPRKARRRK